MVSDVENKEQEGKTHNLNLEQGRHVFLFTHKGTTQVNENNRQFLGLVS
jgi:hypothetical protein